MQVRTNRAMRNDSRGLWLNDALCAYAPCCTHADEVLRMARKLNDTLGENSPAGRLDDDEVITRALAVWDDVRAGRLQRWGAGRRSVVRVTADEIERLPPDVLKLLSTLRAEHTARCRRGETFPIQATAMAQAEFMSRRRVEKARTILLKEHKIELVRPMLNTAAGRIAASSNW